MFDYPFSHAIIDLPVCLNARACRRELAAQSERTVMAKATTVTGTATTTTKAARSRRGRSAGRQILRMEMDRWWPVVDHHGLSPGWAGPSSWLSRRTTRRRGHKTSTRRDSVLETAPASGTWPSLCCVAGSGSSKFLFLHTHGPQATVVSGKAAEKFQETPGAHVVHSDNSD